MTIHKPCKCCGKVRQSSDYILSGRMYRQLYLTCKVGGSTLNYGNLNFGCKKYWRLENETR